MRENKMNSDIFAVRDLDIIDEIEEEDG